MRTWFTRWRLRNMVLIALLFVLAWALFAQRADARGEGHTPVTICHHAGPDPAHWHQIVVDDDSVTLQAHIGHGDTLGPCTDTATPTITASPTLSAASSSESTSTPTPTAPPSGEPSPTPTSTPTASASAIPSESTTPRPTPTAVGLPSPDSTLPPTDTSTTTDSQPIDWSRVLFNGALAVAVGLLTYGLIRRRTER